MSNELTRLRHFLVEHYSLDELKELCFDLGIDYEELREGGKTVKVQEFLLLAGRRRRIEAIIQAIGQDRHRSRLLHEDGIDLDIIRPEELYDQLAKFAPSWGPASRDLRIRENVLKNVHTVWIEGFLKQSLHHTIALELDLAFQPEAVSRTWGIVLQQPGREEQPVVGDQSLRDIFEDHGRSLLILGEPGSGKTITLLQLAEQLIQNARLDSSHPVPVVLNLSSWAAQEKPLTDWLVEEIYLQYQLAKNLARAWIEGNQLLYLLDGLDEVAEESRDDCISAINDFKSHRPAEMVVCSRVADYERLSNRLNLAAAVRIQPLTDAQIKDYLGRKELGMQAVRDMLDSDSVVKELAQSPLTLSIMTLAYGGLREEDLRSQGDAKARRHHLFQTYVRSMFARRPVPDDHLFSREQALDWLSNLAHGMSRHSESVFYIERLQPTWLPQALYRRYVELIGLIVGLIVGLSGGLFVGLTKGLIEGLIVGLIGAPGCAFCIATGNRFASAIRRKRQRFIIGGLSSWIVFGLGGGTVIGLTVRPIAGLIFGLIFGLSIGLMGGFTAYKSEIEAIEAITLRRPSRRKLLQGIGRGLLFGIICGLIGFLGVGMIFWLSVGLSVGQSEALSIGLVFGLIFGLSVGLIGGLMTIVRHREVDQKLQPNQGIRNSLRTTFRLSILVAAFVGFFGWSLDFVLQADRFFLLSLLWFALPLVFLYFGGLAVIQHYTLRLLLSQYNALPRQLVPFLDDMKDRILLRRVGGGYIFIHRTLMEYFAELETD